MEQLKAISFIDAIDITKKLLEDIELPCKYEKPIATINAAIKNLNIIATEMRKAQEAKDGNADDQSEEL